MLQFTSTNPMMYKTAYLVNEAGTQQAFRYKNLDREQIERVQALTGIEITNAKKTIETISGLEFQPKMHIIIDGIKYIVLSVGILESDKENGMFVGSMINATKYLALSR